MVVLPVQIEMELYPKKAVFFAQRQALVNGLLGKNQLENKFPTKRLGSQKREDQRPILDIFKILPTHMEIFQG